MPQHIANASHVACSACTAANATRLAHRGSRYSPTHAGRLIHADIAGPFTCSSIGQSRYLLLLTDDHTRFKVGYFLRRKSDAPAKIKQFIAAFNALANTGAKSPVRVVGTLHSDNAGEFVSREFTEFLSDEQVHQTTSPPHVHQANGVAERSIRSVMSLARSYLHASGVGISYWPSAVEQAIDVLNRTTGPKGVDDDNEPSSYEMLTGQQPRISGIMPFGCRAFAVKPRSQFSKTTIDPRAWVGIHLGRSSRSPGGYEILVPSLGRVVTTSDAYFMESVYPLLKPENDHGDRITPTPTAPPPDTSQPPGIPQVSDHYDDAPDEILETVGYANLARALGGDDHTPSLAAAYEAATRGAAITRESRRILILFSGPYRRPDGLAAFLQQRGFEVDQVDSDAEHGGGEDHSILNDAFFSSLYDGIRAGKYLAIFSAPPCSTYSVARYFSNDSGDGGPPPVRSRSHILGLPDVPGKHKRELRRANEITRRTCVLLSAAHRAGADWAIENPPDRGDPNNRLLFTFPEHGPIWLDPNIIALSKETHARRATFAQCMFGGASQKYTTLMYSAGFDPAFGQLKNMLCSHPPGAHSTAAGGLAHQEDGTSPKEWRSHESAAYPPDLNTFIASGVVSLAVARPTVSSAQPQAADARDAAAAIDQPSAEPVHHDPAPPHEAAHLPPSAPVEPPSPVNEAVTPDSPRPADTPRRRRRIAPEDRFHRGLGAVHTRSRGHVKLAKGSSDDPQNHAAAMAADRAGWTAAERLELANHIKNGSWSYFRSHKVPTGRRVIRFTWVYKTKRDGRQKARLCVQGCTQQRGVDYDQTLCAAMRASSLRILCAVAAREKLKMRRWDFVAAYLQGALEDARRVRVLPAAEGLLD